MSVFWRHSFGSGPIDEIGLAMVAENILAENTFTADRPDDVLAVCETLDDNTAAAVLYRYLVDIRYPDFIADIDARPASQFDVKGKTKLLIVPGFFYLEHPDIGSNGEIVRTAGKSCGFEVDRVPLKSLGTLSENASILHSVLEAEKHPDVCLVSFSKGAAEIRLLIQQLGKDFPPNVHSWISVSGIIGGTPLAALKSRSALHRLFYKGFFPLLGTSFEAVDQMRHDHPFWQKELVLPNTMKCIHVMGIPLLSHMQPLLVKRHQQLSQHGVSDGMSLLQSTMSVPGPIYPIWGADHFLRTPALSALLYRLLHFAARRA